MCIYYQNLFFCPDIGTIHVLCVHTQIFYILSD